MVIGPMWVRPFLRENEELLGELRLPAGLRRRNSSESGMSPAAASNLVQAFSLAGAGERTVQRRRAPRFKSIFGAKQLKSGGGHAPARLVGGPKSAKQV